MKTSDVTPGQADRWNNNSKNSELENRTEIISLEGVENLVKKDNYSYTRPFTGYSFRHDKINEGIFIWSVQMGRYFLIAKK